MCYDVKILSSFHQHGKNQDIDRQKADALWKENSAKAADQHGNKHIADIGANEIIMHIQCDI